jgi:hypothetical protein
MLIHDPSPTKSTTNSPPNVNLFDLTDAQAMCVMVDNSNSKSAACPNGLILIGGRLCAKQITLPKALGRMIKIKASTAESALDNYSNLLLLSNQPNELRGKLSEIGFVQGTNNCDEFMNQFFFDKNSPGYIQSSTFIETLNEIKKYVPVTEPNLQGYKSILMKTNCASNQIVIGQSCVDVANIPDKILKYYQCVGTFKPLHVEFNGKIDQTNQEGAQIFDVIPVDSDADKTFIVQTGDQCVGLSTDGKFEFHTHWPKTLSIV